MSSHDEKPDDPYHLDVVVYIDANAVSVENVNRLRGTRIYKWDPAALKDHVVLHHANEASGASGDTPADGYTSGLR